MRRPSRGCRRSRGHRRPAGTGNRTGGSPRTEPRPVPEQVGAGPAPAHRPSIAGACSLCRRACVAIGRQPLERIAVHVDLREAAGDHLIAGVLPAGEPDVGEEAPVAIARVLAGISAEHDGLGHRQLSSTGGGPGEVTDTSLGRVDADQPDPLALAAREPHVQCVSVDDMGDGSPVGEGPGGCGRTSGIAGRDARQGGEDGQRARRVLRI